MKKYTQTDKSLLIYVFIRLTAYKPNFLIGFISIRKRRKWRTKTTSEINGSPAKSRKQLHRSPKTLSKARTGI
jgi:hypothetical protein